MSTPHDDSNWELSKENIQPIKQGRRAAVLSSTFDDKHQKQLASEKQ